MENYNEKFYEKYGYGKREKALSYLDRNLLDVDYDKGSFLFQAVNEDDPELLDKLLEKGARKKVGDAFEWAAYNGKISCMKVFIKHGMKTSFLKGKVASTNHRLTREFLANQ